MAVKKYCIIVAGGTGRRMKSAIPKQFLLLEGKPLLMHTMERFHSYDSSIEIILVLPVGHHHLWKKLVDEHNFGIGHRLAAGGEERFHSVRAGLELVRQASRDAEHDEAGVHGTGPVPVMNESLIAVHDGVRPLVSHDTIWRCYADAEEFGTAIPFIEPADSVRVIEGDDSRPLPRTVVRLIQTPQVFRSSLIMNAYDRDFDPSFTDDATVAEAAGIKVHLTHGNRENIKITTPEDLAVAHILAGMIRQ
jgi:2-C-methyl-D-erythritol 4-phosphate cytidylyltransferase